MSSHVGIESTGLGQPMRRQHFLFDPEYTPLNHGSYGAFPTVLRDHQRNLQDRIEARSDPFLRFTVPELLVESRAAAASLLGAPIDDVVFVPNATTAVNIVLRNLEFVEGDMIL
jgi:hercynylcysteine S-oxide lyase